MKISGIMIKAKKGLKMKKIVLTMTVAAIMGLALTGCGGASPSAERTVKYDTFYDAFNAYKGELNPAWKKIRTKSVYKK